MEFSHNDLFFSLLTGLKFFSLNILIICFLLKFVFNQFWKINIMHYKENL